MPSSKRLHLLTHSHTRRVLCEAHERIMCSTLPRPSIVFFQCGKNYLLVDIIRRTTAKICCESCCDDAADAFVSLAHSMLCCFFSVAFLFFGTSFIWRWAADVEGVITPPPGAPGGIIMSAGRNNNRLFGRARVEKSREFTGDSTRLDREQCQIERNNIMLPLRLHRQCLHTSLPGRQGPIQSHAT